MSAEQTISEAPQSQAPLALPANMAGESNIDGAGQNASGEGQPRSGMGQSKSSRRRRRKRKGKNEGGVLAEGGSDFEGGDEGSSAPAEGQTIQAAANPQQPRQQNGQQANGAQPQGQTQGKRWKKKFRDRERPARPSRNENPGNQAAPAQAQQPSFSNDNYGNGAGFKRKGRPQQQQRRERSGFVGPMDHSYRAMNSDFNGASPATIEVHGNYKQKSHGRGQHHGDSQPIDHSLPRPIPIPENAQTHIYFFVEDLFVTAKIHEAAKKLGVKVGFVKNEKEELAHLTSGEELDKPALIVFDLNNANAKPLTLIPKLKTKLKRSVSIVGFLSHLQGDLKAKAVEAGCDSVMPRAAFSQNLPNLLRRYGVHDEEEEQNFNQ